MSASMPRPRQRQRNTSRVCVPPAGRRGPDGDKPEARQLRGCSCCSRFLDALISRAELWKSAQQGCVLARACAACASRASAVHRRVPALCAAGSRAVPGASCRGQQQGWPAPALPASPPLGASSPSPVRLRLTRAAPHCRCARGSRGASHGASRVAHNTGCPCPARRLQSPVSSLCVSRKRAFTASCTTLTPAAAARAHSVFSRRSMASPVKATLRPQVRSPALSRPSCPLGRAEASRPQCAAS